MYASPLLLNNDGFSQQFYRDGEASTSIVGPFHLSQAVLDGGSGGGSSRRKAIYDRLYGQMLFPPVFDIFIDSPQVQRLRDLKQLGNTHYIYPGATNTRFEHSLGTAHLAMEFLKQIYANHQEERDYIAPSVASQMGAFGSPQPVDPVCQMLTSEYDSAVKDVWCVGIAGLCHDLGHGPLSHMFERYVNKVRQGTSQPRWHHEEASLAMVDAIWSAHEDTLYTCYGLDAKDRAFVKLCIEGIKPDEPWDETRYGRPAWKRFMTEIVANKRNGLDVDKLDYLQRDYMCCCGMPSLPSMSRLFQGARALADDKGQYQIAYQEKLDGTVDAVFNARAHLHRIIYQHRVTCVMDEMIIDAFMAAHEHFRLHDAEGHAYSLSECVDHPEVYVKTGDWIVKAMLNHPGEGMRRTREILMRIDTRDIYVSVRSFDAPRFTRIAAHQDAPARTSNSDGRARVTFTSERRACTPSRDDKDAHDQDDQELVDEGVSQASSDLIHTPVGSASIVVRPRPTGVPSGEDVHSYILNTLHVSASLRERMRLWESENNHLPVIALLTVCISKVASDMNATEEPLTRVGFFHHRYIGAHPAGGTLCRCRCTTRQFAPLKPEVRYVVVSRMQLGTDELDELSAALKYLLTEEQKQSTRSFSATPRRELEDARAQDGEISAAANSYVPQLDGIDSLMSTPRAVGSAGRGIAHRSVTPQASSAVARTLHTVSDADDEVIVVDDVHPAEADVEAQRRTGAKRLRSRTPSTPSPRGQRRVQ